MSSPNPTDGWCPFATRYATSKFWSGNQGRRAVVMHIAQGSYEAAVSWLSNDQSNPDSSAHFVIAKDGRIAQLVSIWDSAWANGLRWSNGQWYTPGSPPRPVNPSWVDMIPGVNPNLYTISVEHEGVYQDRWTPEMYAANTRLLQWIASQLGQPSAPIQWIAHRNLIGHFEIDPVTRANCPGPTVNFEQMALDANASTTDLFSRIVPATAMVHIYGTTPLVSLPGYTIVKQLTETDIPVAGYLDYQGTRWYISQYSYQNHITNFFDSSTTQVPVQDLTLSLGLNPGYRDAVTPSADELRALGPQWIRVLLFSQYQNSQTGQNTELDWLLDRYRGLGVRILALVNTETLGQVPPAHGPGWGDANSGYIGRASDLMGKIAAYYRERIAAIEVFNEPDVQGILPEDYAALLVAGYAKIKAAGSLPVVSAGICCGENLDYLRKVARIARGAYDFTGWHVYAERVDGWPSPSFGFGELRNSLSSARALGGKPLWITETGAQLDWTWPPDMTSGDAVAAYLTRAFTLMRTLGCNTVSQAFWFTWRIAGESWGLVDDGGNRRPAWAAFQQAAGGPDLFGPPTVTQAIISPLTLEQGQTLTIRATVKNNSDATLETEGPDPGFVYDEGQTFEAAGFPARKNAFRIGLDYDGRTGWDHPYRWGLGAPLPPGATATITGGVRLSKTGTRNFWLGLVQELATWLADKQGLAGITVTEPGPGPGGRQPTITSITLSPTTLDAGSVLNVTIVVRNDSGVSLPTQAPDPGFAYGESDSFSALGFKESKGAFRVGIDFAGRSGIDHPYRWGLGAPLAPGESKAVTGTIRLSTPQTRRYWAGLVCEQIAWLQDNQGAQVITVKGPPPPAGQAAIASASFAPTTISQGDLVTVKVTVVNGTTAPLATQGPDPGFFYNEGDNFFTKGFPPASGAFRVGVDFDGRTGVDHPYRWGLGAPLGPGQSVTVTGSIRLNRRQTTRFWVGLIKESVALLQDQQGITTITVERP